MLGKLFRPRWQHRDPKVRIEAVERLDSHNNEDLGILATLARGDISPEVRAAAASRLTDLQQLDTLARQDPDSTVRDAAALQVCRLLAGTAEHCPVAENRLRLVMLTDNQQVLAYVAREGVDNESRRAAIQRLDDQQTLFELALEAQTAELRQLAGQGITDLELLKRLGREGRDKKVQRDARERAREQQEQTQQREQQAQAREHLIDQLRQHASRGADPLYEAKLDQLGRQWQGMEPEATETQKQEAIQWLETCRQRIHRWHEEAAEARRAREAGSEQQETVSTLDALARNLAHEQWQNEAGSLRAAVQTQLNRWASAADYRAPDAKLAERFRTLSNAWLTALEIVAQLGETPEPDDALLAALRERWPGELPAPPALVETAPVKQAATPEPEPVADSPLPPVLGALTRELQKRNLRHANRLWTKAEALLEQHPDSRAEARLEKLKPQLTELRDWHSFAAEPKKQMLCERMEALVDQPMDAPEKATAIQALHDEWRELMSSDQDADQALWDRFKAASDQAYEPCREYFREQDKEKRANLQKRQALCDQLADFISKQDWLHADWPAVWEIRQQAPKEWRDYQPVRFTDSRDAQKRFSGLLEQLDKALEQASEEHLIKLQALTEKAEALVESDNVDEACEQARNLQQQWKKAEWVYPRQYRPLHKRFRKACDRIFQARDQARQAQKEEHAGEEKALDQALEQLSAALNQPVAQIDSGALNQEAEICRELPCPPHARALRERRNDLLTRVKKLNEALPQWRRWQELHDRVASTEVLEETPEQRKLAVTLEVLTGETSPEGDREQRMALQLELLPRAMKAGSEAASLKKVEALLQEHEAMLEQGMSADVRDRLLRTLAVVKPVV